MPNCLCIFIVNIILFYFFKALYHKFIIMQQHSLNKSIFFAVSINQLLYIISFNRMVVVELFLYSIK
ncbi:hypothetical protein KBTX_04180 [wastewater metagenome]|uniref:Uncharacterized protein n=2 Tax=unclassified sequences TaxID=12908 RepID=A0A5B8RKN2_9ZZZZ|nr:hypothetical protein KBTEX_04180 [uncultured organism]